MFDTKEFGAYISRLRKNVDMTQSEVAEKLNLTRQAVSKYEVGDSFPDISILLKIAEIFCISIDSLINSGKPSHGEASILKSIATNEENVIAENVSDFVNLAPLLKPSILAKMAKGLGKQGIDISNIVILAEHLNDESVLKLLENATFDTLSEDLLEKLIPFLDDKSKTAIFDKILTSELDWHMIKILLPYTEYLISPIESAVIEGALPFEALDVMRETLIEVYRRNSLP